MRGTEAGGKGIVQLNGTARAWKSDSRSSITPTVIAICLDVHMGQKDERSWTEVWCSCHMSQKDERSWTEVWCSCHMGQKDERSWTEVWCSFVVVLRTTKI